ncbi:MAG: hypothetical protein HQ519_03020 [Planctomycetes bacterium]|nr:hypothetical protein [Planctomycetota bacterium]
MNFRPAILMLLGALWTPTVGQAQVHYQPNGQPWKQKASAGPDAQVPGWYYNLGITGIRVELMEEHPQALMVRYVFPDSPADGKVQAGDLIVGVDGKSFQVAHQNGYGMDKFGPHGPISDFAQALDACQQGAGPGVKAKLKTKAGNGTLNLMLQREGKKTTAKINVGSKYGAYSKSFPNECAKTDLILAELLDYLVANQQADGSWGSAPHNTFAPLALMSSDKKSHRDALLKNVKMHAKTTKAVDESWLINWRYMSAAIVLSEYYLLTGEKWLLPELQEIYDFLVSTQYVDLSQVNPKAKESHPHTYPTTQLDSHGGWGHNPGFEGYGPIAMITAQGALAFAMMKQCGIDVDADRHAAAYAFLDRAAGKNHYVWYKDQAAGDQNWADMGRTGAAAIANRMYAKDKKHKRRSIEFASVIGQHPDSFADTHGSPIMGMAYGALGASCDPRAFRSLMDANKWWFTLSQCTDGSFYYQPNRDNAGYGADSRISATAAVAFILSIPKAATTLTGR